MFIRHNNQSWFIASLKPTFWHSRAKIICNLYNEHMELTHNLQSQRCQGIFKEEVKSWQVNLLYLDQCWNQLELAVACHFSSRNIKEDFIMISDIQSKHPQKN